MTKINLPEDLLQMQTYKSLSAKEKEEYVNNMFKKVLELNPEGVTISQIREATGLTASTIWHHLEILKSNAQSRKISHGNLDVFYSCGASTPLDEFEHGKAIYTLSVSENNEGRFVCIHEKRKNRLGSNNVVRGILLPVELIDDFAKTLSKAKKPLK